MANEPVSLRLNKDLLDRLDADAKREGATRTQVMERALQFWASRGSLGIGGMLPPGLSQAFQEFLESVAKTGGGVTVLVLDPTGRQPWVYSGDMFNFDATNALTSGVVTLRVRDADESADSFEINLAKGSIIGWDVGSRSAQRWRLGVPWQAIDGNEYIARLRRGEPPV